MINIFLIFTYIIGIITPSLVNARSIQSTANFNYVEAWQKSLHFFDGQFSGKKPEWAHLANWRDDCHTQDGKDVGLDLSGNFMDCGDGLMFLMPQAFTFSMLGWNVLEYKSTYKKYGQLDYVLSVIKWEMDFFMRAHPEPNVLYGQIGSDDDHDYWVGCEYSPASRPAYQVNVTCPGSDIASLVSSALTIASILFQDINSTLASQYLLHARQLFTFATTYQGKYSDCITDSANYYASGGYWDAQIWASLWLYNKTLEPQYHDYAYHNSRSLVKQFMSWAPCWNSQATNSMYLMCKWLKDSDACYQMENSLNYWAANGLSTGGNIQYTPGGLAFLSGWGSNRYSAVMAYIALLYVDNTQNLAINLKQDYTNFAKSQIDYILGNNPYNTSYLVGFGDKWFPRWHHRNAHGSSIGSMSSPLNNRHIHYIMIGGPNADDTFSDEIPNYVNVESGLDYMASFISGVTAMAAHGGGHTLILQPETPGLEYFVNSTLQQQNLQTQQATFFFVSQTGWPMRSPNLMFKVFFQSGIPDLKAISYYNQNATISKIGHCSHTLDYLNISFGAGFVYPFSTVTSIKQVQIAFSSSSVLALNNSWSFNGVSDILLINPNIPIYELVKSKWVRQFGNEPICSESFPTPTPIPTPAGYWKCMICARLE